MYRDLGIPKCASLGQLPVSQFGYQLAPLTGPYIILSVNRRTHRKSGEVHCIGLYSAG